MSSWRPLAITGGWRGRELRRRATPRSFVSAGVTHTAEGRHTPCINQAARYTAGIPAGGAAEKLPLLHRVESVRGPVWSEVDADWVGVGEGRR